MSPLYNSYVTLVQLGVGAPTRQVCNLALAPCQRCNSMDLMRGFEATASCLVLTILWHADEGSREQDEIVTNSLGGDVTRSVISLPKVNYARRVLVGNVDVSSTTIVGSASGVIELDSPAGLG